MTNADSGTISSRISIHQIQKLPREVEGNHAGMAWAKNREKTSAHLRSRSSSSTSASAFPAVTDLTKRTGWMSESIRRKNAEKLPKKKKEGTPLD